VTESTVRCAVVTSAPPAGSSRQLVDLGRSFVAVAVCAQLAHGVLYESVLPRAGAHDYLSWYVPTLALAVVAALGLLPLTLERHVAGSGGRSLARVLPERIPGRAARDIARLTIASAGYLFVQETFERTSLSGTLRVASFSPLAWIAIALALVLAATVVVALERTLTAIVLGRTFLPRWPVQRSAGRRSVGQTVIRRRPQAVHGGLRAPPVTA
jgi:hypothetical protein